MKNKKLSILLVISLVIVAGLVFSTNGAQAKSNQLSNAQGKGYGFERNLAIKSKILNVTVEWLKNAINSGKTFLDILKDKGLTIQWFKDQMKLTKINEINQLLANKKITSDQAQTMIQQVQNQNRVCDGTCEPGQGNKQGQGQGIGLGKFRDR